MKNSDNANVTGMRTMTRNDGRRFRPVFKTALFLGLAMGIAGTLSATDGFERVWTKRFPLSPGGRVSVENVHGDVCVEGWERAEVEAVVVMTAQGSAEHLPDVKVAVEMVDGALAFHTLYPQGLDEPVSVDYQLRVPRQVQLKQLSTLQGDITVRNVDGSVEARNLHGDIQEENVSGAVVARALTGDIVVSLHVLPDAKTPVVLETINGNIDLVLPPRPNADLELKTVAGRIEGTYVFQTSAVPGDSTRRTCLGKGGARVLLRTIRGDIRVGERKDTL
jgi:hypothetical protein